MLTDRFDQAVRYAIDLRGRAEQAWYYGELLRVWAPTSSFAHLAGIPSRGG